MTTKTFIYECQTTVQVNSLLRRFAWLHSFATGEEWSHLNCTPLGAASASPEACKWICQLQLSLALTACGNTTSAKRKIGGGKDLASSNNIYCVMYGLIFWMLIVNVNVVHLYSTKCLASEARFVNHTYVQAGFRTRQHAIGAVICPGVLSCPERGLQILTEGSWTIRDGVCSFVWLRE